MKVLKFIIEGIFWIMIFLSPFILFAIAAGIMYLKTKNLFYFPFGFLVVGAGVGILVAEKIRRKYGCSTFMGKLLRTPEIEKKE